MLESSLKNGITCLSPGGKKVDGRSKRCCADVSQRKGTAMLRHVSSYTHIHFVSCILFNSQIYINFAFDFFFKTGYRSYKCYRRL